MKTSIWGLLLVAGLSATNAILPTQAPLLSFEEAVKLALKLYNEKSGDNQTYELVDAAPESEWDPTSPRPQHFSMKMKPRCQSKDTDSEKQCDFQDGGVVKLCPGYFVLQEEPPVVVVGCEEVSEEEDEVKDEDEDKVKAKDEDEDEDEDEEKEENKEPERKREKRFLKKLWKKGKKGLSKRLKRLKKKKLVYVAASIPF